MNTPKQLPYSRLRAIGRDPRVENEVRLEWRPPSAEEHDELLSLLAGAAESLGARAPHLNIPRLVLSSDLSKEQRLALEAYYVPRYAAALEQDEQAREAMNFDECGERMVDLRALAAKDAIRIMWSSAPFNAACGEFAGKPRIFWAREAVAECFMRLSRAYNFIGLTPHVEDAYRPPAVQEGLFRRRVKLVRKENPSLEAEQVLLEVYAKTARAPYRAAHMAGAAIDFTLREADGQPLDLGNPYPTGGAAAVLWFPYVTWAQYRTRALFAEVSRMAGLQPYPGEDWHVSKGDGLAAIMEGEKRVRYCALRDFNRASGEIVPYDPVEAREVYSHEGLL